MRRCPRTVNLPSRAYTQLRLDPLPPASAEAFLAASLGDDPSLAPLTSLLIARTAGTPSFWRRACEPWSRRGSSGVSRGPIGWYNLQEMPVPATVQAVLAARIDRLPPRRSGSCKRLPWWVPRYPCPWCRPSPSCPKRCCMVASPTSKPPSSSTRRGSFLSASRFSKHALTHEVAYGSLLLERRRGLHARIVEALEALAPERLAEQVERLAHHAVRGEVWDKAATYCRQAGDKALARSAYREAGGYFEQALRALQHLPETRDTRERAIDLQLALRTALYPSRDVGRILACLRQAESLAVALNDPQRLSQVSRFLSRHFSIMGAHDQAIAAAPARPRAGHSRWGGRPAGAGERVSRPRLLGPAQLSSGDRLLQTDRNGA